MLLNSNISMRFRHIDWSNDLIDLIATEAQKLQQRHPQVRICAVAVEKRHQRHLRGNPIRARVILRLPGKIIVSSKRNDDPDESTCALGALFHAFGAAEDAVAAYIDRRRGVRHGAYRPRPAAGRVPRTRRRSRNGAARTAPPTRGLARALGGGR